MNNPLEQNYLSSKDAGASLGYTHDYISRLCRQGKMEGIQKGREWYVTPQELEAFKARHELELQEKKKELSKKFSQIRLEHEAKKRAARTTSSTSHTKVSSDEVRPNKIKIQIPRELVAVCLLAVFVFSPSILNTFSQAPSRNSVSADVSDFSIKNITSSLEQGVQDTIYAQSTVVEPVAAIFSFAPYLADGYWQFFQEVGKLPKETLSSLHSIGSAYLVLYLLQGQALYMTIGDLNTLGATVLRGYELIGESFLYGSKDIIRTYSKILQIEPAVTSSSDAVGAFTSNVSGGFDYMILTLQTGPLADVFEKTTQIAFGLQQNIITNTDSVRQTLGSVSEDVTAYAGNFFEFNLIEKEEKIRAIRLKE